MPDVTAVKSIRADHRRRSDCLGEADVLYRPGLSRFARRLIGDKGRADDIVQETFVKLWQHPQLLRQPPVTLRPWLFTVTRNLAYDELRSGRRRHEFLAGEDDVLERGTADPCSTVADTVVVQRALATLSHDHRIVIWHAYFRGVSTGDIANELAIPRGTVKSRLHYALRALRSACTALGVTVTV